MLFKIGGKDQNIEVTSVVLEYNPNLIQKGTIEGLMLWHCPIDNQPLFQYSARMVAIVPGMVETKVPIIHQCPKCRTKYLVSQII